MSPAVLPFASIEEHHRAELDCLDRALRILLQLFHVHDEGSAGQGWFLQRHQVDSWLAEPAEPSPEIINLRQDVPEMRERLQARIAATEAAGRALPLAALARKFGLSPAEEIAVLVCFAPEIDGKYARIYAYLQDDLTRRLPALDLVNRIAGELGFTSAWHSSSPLFRHQIVQFAGEGDAAHRLCRGTLLNEVVRKYLTEPAPAPTPGWPPEGIAARLSALAGATAGRTAIQLHGPSAADCEAVARSICEASGLRLHTHTLIAFSSDAVLEALLHGGALLVSEIDTPGESISEARRGTLEALLPAAPKLVFLVSAQPWFPKQIPPDTTFVSAQVPIPDFGTRQRLWAKLLAEEPGALDTHDIATVASRYRLPHSEMEQVLQVARTLAELKGSPLAFDDLKTACRVRSRSTLGPLARLVTPRLSWDALVLPDDIVYHLREVCAHVRHRVRVFHEWGFDARLSLGRGLYALFLGPSGTGKTLAAEVVANELGQDLLKVDLANVVSKYIGETEKNLQRVFEVAERSDAILFFDEADALFGKRSEIKDAHDRYANIEIDFLLQRLEEFEGIAILATNFAQNIDDAFRRRIHMTVEFPFPGESSRLAIWKNHFPSETPLARDVDFEFLSKRLPITGGNIRNIVLNAAFGAAEDGGTVGMRHLLYASRREYEKIGKPYREEDLTK